MTSKQKPDLSADQNVASRLTAAISHFHQGQREHARQEFGAIWQQLKDTPDPYRACILAHFMADTQDRLEDELYWDIIALDAAFQALSATGASRSGDLDVNTFLPSLHLNLGDDYLRLGDDVKSAEQLCLAQKALKALPDSPYCVTIRGGITRLEEQLNGARRSLAASPGALPDEN
jgi:hypothetical protein